MSEEFYIPIGWWWSGSYIAPIYSGPMYINPHNYYACGLTLLYKLDLCDIESDK